ncbi:MAG TPA: GYD domain-containing protein [Methanomassiliicoccales archaeon]|nr:GYD domain-containing protein [Methanomassiliicoccales archaeon]
MIFIGLNKFRQKPTTAAAAKVNKLMGSEGIKPLGMYVTLGGYDSIVIYEAPDEKTALKAALNVSDIFETETLVAIPREEFVKFLE